MPILASFLNEQRKNGRITSFEARLSGWETHFPEVFWGRRRNIQKSVSGTCRQLLLFFLLWEMSVILLKKMFFFLTYILQENESVHLLSDKHTISHSLQVVPFSFLLSSFLRITATWANVGRLHKKHRIREFQTMTRTEKSEWSVSYWALFPFLWLIEASWGSSNMWDSNTQPSVVRVQQSFTTKSRDSAREAVPKPNS